MCLRIDLELTLQGLILLPLKGDRRLRVKATGKKLMNAIAFSLKNSGNAKQWERPDQAAEGSLPLNLYRREP